MKRLFFISMLFLLGVACSQDDSLTATVDPVPEGGRNANPYAVTVEEALANLEGVLAQIDGETRAGGMRRAVSVDRVKAADVCDLTRSEAALDVEDLLYVVSFGEGNGSAVLGADKRVTRVMAVLDETVLTAEDFVKFDTRATSLEELSPKEDLQNMLTDMITATAEAEVASVGEEVIGPLPMIGEEISYSYIKRRPLLDTKWSQSKPFNNSCPLKSPSTISRHSAGCVPVGVGQILAYYQYPSPNIIDDTLYNWSLINQLNYPSDPNSCSEDAKETTANYLRKLGRMMYAEYRNDGTFVYDSHQINFLKTIGFPNARTTAWDNDFAYNMIYSNSEPLGIGVYRLKEDGTSTGHFWVLDGWMDVIKNVWRLVKEYGAVLPERTLISSTLDSQLVHCNFGWGGTCDGYYTPNTYDLTIEKTGVYIEPLLGDIPNTMNRIYNFNVRITRLE